MGDCRKRAKRNSRGAYSFLKKNEKQNKSYVCTPKTLGGKEAKLSYRLIKSSDNYHLLEVHLETGRHHQIRAQLSTIGCAIKGDLKYGAKDLIPMVPSVYMHANYLLIIRQTKSRSR